MTGQISVFATPLRFFQGTKMSVLVANEAGQTLQQTKDGPVPVPFCAGDVLLARMDDSVVVGPISHEAAFSLSERVLNGDQRAVTDPLSILALAAAVIGFSRFDSVDHPSPAAPGVAANG